MPSGKDRLYIGHYARDVPHTYHWTFLKTPKAATDTPKETIRYRVANRPAARDGITKDTWFFEKRELVSLKTQMLLVRVLVAKIEGSQEDIEVSLQHVPVIQDDSAWVDTGVLDWDMVERESVLCRKNREGRFQNTPIPEGVPRYDLIEKKELVS